MKEFIEHYKKYGIDKIYLYDNNDLNGENFDFLHNEINSRFIEILNYRGKKTPQREIYNKCYINNSKKYKWILFFDIDEYIFLTNFSDIHEYLSQSKFIKCNSIYLNWLIHTDNELIYYDNRTLKERFPKVIKDKKYCKGKSIVKTNIHNIKITSTHILDKNLKICDGFGNLFKPKKFYCKVPDFKFNFVEHYQYKSTEEFVEKINLKGDCLFENNLGRKYKKIFDYFRFNRITSKKINYILKNTGLNSTFIMENLRKIKKEKLYNRKKKQFLSKFIF